MKTRIYFLDNLRTFLIFLVIVVHAGMVYESGFDSFWIVNDPAKSNNIALVRLYLDIFVMFIMFFISGYFIPNSLKSKNSWGFIKSKFNRIIIPWLVAVFTLIPAYKAIFLYSRNLPQEPWFSYFHVFQRAGSDLSYFPNNPSQSWLWFLPILFLFQIIYLILAKNNLLNIKISLKTAVISTIVIGFLYSMLISITGLKGWTLSPLLDFQRERLFVYFLIFLLGSLCFKLKIFDSKIKNKKLYLISNIVLTLSLVVFTIFALNLFYNIVDPYRNHFFVSSLLDRAIYYFSFLISMFSFLYIFIYTFRFTFYKSNKMMNELNRDSYNVYIIHMIVLGMIAVLLLNISFHPILKYLILIILTFVLSHLLTYIFRKTMPKLNSKITIPIIIILSILITILVYQKKDSLSEINNTSTNSISKVARPNIGLHQAAFEGNIEEVNQHILFGSDLNIKENSTGNSPLITAAVFGKKEVVKALIKAGANVNYQGADGSTALHGAAYFCHVEIVKILLNNGCDKTIQDNSEKTAFDIVSSSFPEAIPGYEYFKNELEPHGFKIDFKYLRKTRPVIAEIIKNY